MITILRELFSPPYDIFQILLIILVVMFGVYTCGVIVLSLQKSFANHKINRFFSVHRPPCGIVVRYEATDGDTVVSSSPVIPGSLLLTVPRIHQTEDQYAIILECHADGAHFNAKYQIPRSNYKKYKKGQTVQIEQDWEPIGYEELQGSTD